MLVELNHVSKVYSGQEGLQDASFKLEAGQVVGLFGLNGSGKTTTLKLIAGLLQADQGSVQILGQNPRHSRHQVAYLSDRPSFYPWMKPKDIEGLMTQLFTGVDGHRFSSLLAALEIPNKALGKMSKGQQQRLRFVATMSRNCPIYLLDEPLSGIDLLSRRLITEVLTEDFYRQGVMIISTHEIDAVESLFDRGIFLKKGQIISDIQGAELRRDSQSFTEHFITINRGEA